MRRRQADGATDATNATDAPNATDWLRFQRTLALWPEVASTGLREGHSPDCILARFRSQALGADVRRATSWGAREHELEWQRGERDRRRLDEIEARVLPLTDSAYPASLSALRDAPAVLLVRGEPAVLAGPSVAIIGARAATRAGRSHARRLARELAAHGLTIVSGLARGIDAEAHRGALEVGGRTIGVLACGVDQTYPPEHRALADEICRDGAVVSEMPLGTAPRRELFPLRNRIISGLCLGVIVVEARRRSGSLITVRHALHQGREVFVVPGASDGPFAEGSNRLLREGARAITTAADVLEDLGGFGAAREMLKLSESTAPSSTTPRHSQESAVVAPSPERRPGDPVEERILAELERGPASRDDLVIRVEIDPGKLARALLDLELAGRIVEERDGHFHLCWT